MTDSTPATAATWRDWHFGDEPCTYALGCSEPLRSHYHLNPGPGQRVIVVYYDQAGITSDVARSVRRD